MVLGKGPIAIFGIQISSCPRQLIEEMMNWRAKSLVAQVSKYLLNDYFMPDSLVPYSFWAAQEWEKLNF